MTKLSGLRMNSARSAAMAALAVVQILTIAFMLHLNRRLLGGSPQATHA